MMHVLFIGLLMGKIRSNETPRLSDDDIRYVADMLDADYREVRKNAPRVRYLEDSRAYKQYIKPRLEESAKDSASKKYFEGYAEYVEGLAGAFYFPETNEIVLVREDDTEVKIHELVHAVRWKRYRKKPEEEIIDSEDPFSEYIIPTSATGFRTLTYNDFVEEIREEALATLVSLCYEKEHGEEVSSTSPHQGDYHKKTLDVLKRKPRIPKNTELFNIWQKAYEEDSLPELGSKMSQLAHLYGQMAVKLLFQEGLLDKKDVKTIMKVSSEEFIKFMNDKYRQLVLNK